MGIYFKNMKEEQKEKNGKKEENNEGSFKQKVLGKILALVITAAAAGIGGGVYSGIYNCTFRDVPRTKDNMLAYIDTSHIQKLILTSKNPQEQLEQIIAQLAPEQRQEMMARVVYNTAKNDELNEKGAYSAALLFFQSYQRQKGNKGDILWEK